MVEKRRVHLDEAASQLLSGPNFGVLSTLMSDGSPHSTAVWVDVDGDLVLVATIKQTRKYDNVLADPRVALTVTSHDNPYHELSARGRVLEIREDRGALIDKLSQQYYGVTPYPHHQPNEEWVALVIEVLKVRIDTY